MRRVGARESGGSVSQQRHVRDDAGCMPTNVEPNMCAMVTCASGAFWQMAQVSFSAAFFFITLSRHTCTCDLKNFTIQCQHKRHSIHNSVAPKSHQVFSSVSFRSTQTSRSVVIDIEYSSLGKALPTKRVA